MVAISITAVSHLVFTFDMWLDLRYKNVLPQKYESETVQSLAPFVN